MSLSPKICCPLTAETTVMALELVAATFGFGAIRGNSKTERRHPQKNFVALSHGRRRVHDETTSYCSAKCGGASRVTPPPGKKTELDGVQAPNVYGKRGFRASLAEKRFATRDNSPLLFSKGDQPIQALPGKPHGSAECGRGEAIVQIGRSLPSGGPHKGQPNKPSLPGHTSGNWTPQPKPSGFPALASSPDQEVRPG